MHMGPHYLKHHFLVFATLVRTNGFDCAFSCPSQWHGTRWPATERALVEAVEPWTASSQMHCMDLCHVSSLSIFVVVCDHKWCVAALCVFVGFEASTKSVPGAGPYDANAHGVFCVVV